MLNKKELDLFLAKILVVQRSYKTPCWEWQGCTNESGYGRVKIRRMSNAALGAHRIALMHYRGFDLDGELWALHHCDNPPCCNPDHLYAGTLKNNVDDMLNRGRQNNGERAGSKNGNNKLSDDEVRRIVSLLPKYNNKQIASIFEQRVTHSAVSTIRRGKAWSELTGIKPGDFKKYQSMKKIMGR